MYELKNFKDLRIHTCFNVYDKEFIEQRNHHETYCATTYPELTQDGTIYTVGIDIDHKSIWYNKHFKLSDEHLIELEMHISVGKSYSIPLCTSGLIPMGGVEAVAELSLARRVNAYAAKFALRYDPSGRYITALELHVPVDVGNELFNNFMTLKAQYFR
jgi:hypothetical protein